VPGRGDRTPAQPEGLIGRSLYRAILRAAVVIPPIIVATVMAQRVSTRTTGPSITFIAILLRQAPGSVQIAWLTDPGNPIWFFPLLPLSYFALLTANVWLGWPLNAVWWRLVRCRASRRTSTRPSRSTEEVHGPSSGRDPDVFCDRRCCPSRIYGFVITFNLFYLSYFIVRRRAVRQNRAARDRSVPSGQ